MINGSAHTGCYPSWQTWAIPKGLMRLNRYWNNATGGYYQQSTKVKYQTINGRVRRCASQEGNCYYYSLALGLADDRTEELAARLIKWQWEDGGWNCDKRPEASISSFNETLIPLRGLVLYANIFR